MELLSLEFLEKVAEEKRLNSEQTRVFIQRVSNTNTVTEDADILSKSPSAVTSCMSEVFRRFQLNYPGPNKTRDLRDYLIKDYGKKRSDNITQNADAQSLETHISRITDEVRKDIRYRCGAMKVLGMERPININDIYTDVYVREKSPIWLASIPSLEDQDYSFCEHSTEDKKDKPEPSLSRIRKGERLLGIDVVNQHSRLMILGEPGSGKTIFAKYLAMLYHQSDFRDHPIPIFVTLKHLSIEKGDRLDLLNYVTQRWIDKGILEEQEFLALSAEPLIKILREGRALVILDGLDEACRNEQSDRVIPCINDFSQRFEQCNIVVTCRNAARDCRLEWYTEFEIVDFGREQVFEFIENWFDAVGDIGKNDNLKDNLKDRFEHDASLRDLARNPLLLTLICFTFYKIPERLDNRNDLLSRALQMLLDEWNYDKHLESDTLESGKLYAGLSTRQKEELLREISYSTFTRNIYYFKPRDVETQITKYLRGQSNVGVHARTTESNVGVILRTIEEQHGLLVNRYETHYTFSYLTFQEYFTAQKIAMSSKRSTQELTELASHVAERRYKEVFLLVASILERGSGLDSLMESMKCEIDQIMADDAGLQQFLSCISDKSESIDADYEIAPLRAFYFSLALDRALDLERDLDLSRDRPQVLNFALQLKFGLDLERKHEVDRVTKVDIVSLQDALIYIEPDRSPELDLDRLLDLTLDRCLDFDFAISTNLSINLTRSLACAIRIGLSRVREKKELNSALEEKLKDLADRLPPCRFFDNFKKWWIKKGSSWREDLRYSIIEHRIIGHDWKFTAAQREKLKQYYYANQLLVECLSSQECHVKASVKKSIMNSLLLPNSRRTA